MKAEELREGIAAILRDMRQKKGLSKSKMADIADIDSHTWSSWESGKSCPSVVDFIDLCDRIGENPIRQILSIMNPSVYSDDSQSKRDEITHYISTTATDHTVDIMHYIMFGDHGSKSTTQAEMMCALDHLPNEYRYIIDEMIYMMYIMGLKRRELVCMGDTTPNMDSWAEGLKADQRSAYAVLRSYTKDGE